ncbi:MAG TPA: DNA-binding response regulator, partial [Pseudogracilibacillus sp.]|nr:DNA-binding response regulator [Pseudogracilibacillus sp.]
MSNSQKILVVDDEDRIRRLLRMYLERDDFEVEEAENGADA